MLACSRPFHGLLWVITLVALAGCGKTQGPTVPTAQRSVPAKDSDYDKALRYTRRMTASGVVTPDPVEGEPLVTADHIEAGCRRGGRFIGSAVTG